MLPVVDVVNASGRFDFIVYGADFRASIGVVNGLRMGHIDLLQRVLSIGENG